MFFPRTFAGEILKIIPGTGGTVMMGTHDVEEAVLLSERIVMMTNGPAAKIGEIPDIDLDRPHDRVPLAHSKKYMDCRTQGARISLSPARQTRTSESGLTLLSLIPHH